MHSKLFCCSELSHLLSCISNYKTENRKSKIKCRKWHFRYKACSSLTENAWKSYWLEIKRLSTASWSLTVPKRLHIVVDMRILKKLYFWFMLPVFIALYQWMAVEVFIKLQAPVYLSAVVTRTQELLENMLELLESARYKGNWAEQEWLVLVYLGLILSFTLLSHLIACCFMLLICSLSDAMFGVCTSKLVSAPSRKTILQCSESSFSYLIPLNILSGCFWRSCRVDRNWLLSNGLKRGQV